MNYDGTNADEMMRTARTRRDKALRFEGEFDEEVREGDPNVCYVIYQGDSGWEAYLEGLHRLGGGGVREVEASFDVYDRVDLVDIANTPDAVEL